MTYNVRLLLEYDGTNFHGWQRQAGLPTIQGTLEEALARITKQPATLFGAGRTDAGVHAAGQVANFRSSLKLTESSWVKAINSLVPPDIVIRSAEYVPPEFHARYSAKSKVYQYTILTSEQRAPFLRNYVWHVRQPLNIPAMQEASGYLIGTHDFSSFRASECVAKSPVRTLDRLEITYTQLTATAGQESAMPQIRRDFLIPLNRMPCNATMILFTLKARSYLQHMVRNIIGTLNDVGRGRFKPSDVREILEKKDRRYAGPIAPPQGLVLLSVIYDDVF
ncbi:MAG: tRNA pseudouridine(38-40) synthase TruA [Nitrospirae bacterium]|nr:tRNA pseudouridine(38-40) synthase TruA [Nitrospirota bacterium]